MSKEDGLYGGPGAGRPDGGDDKPFGRDGIDLLFGGGPDRFVFADEPAEFGNEANSRLLPTG